MGSKQREWIKKVRDPEYTAFTERVYVIRVEASIGIAKQHIVPRYTDEEIREAVVPAENGMHELERENEKLREELARFGKKNGNC